MKYGDKGIVVENVDECTPPSAIPVVRFDRDPDKR